jgi:hypothetical protein
MLRPANTARKIAIIKIAVMGFLGADRRGQPPL